ncbi:hypothetical protein C5B42_00100 [Candidatus Cerribacteria bacterium 'Amazon FNV 2010 28 9']|uniref:Uncharacterized protein n=1 Tax=Candidatus Cerribacteria bacterium 'Amazon FNV 2010 28 9' TaxID=2081795 RepID=A0A317JQ97_9BACT|nr:MAG: hypothetical protein C5B42_00100 [Candidatus Cerribacteria bacterium 'Amazon FNV 2010 28 9']
MQLESLLTQGLVHGFIQGENLQTSHRGWFNVQGTHYEPAEGGGMYNDQYVAGNQTAGGQELARESGVDKNKEIDTRLYGGGTIALEELDALGITSEDILTKLKWFIQQLGETARLQQDIPLQKNGDWSYRYTMTETVPTIPVQTSKEELFYKDQLVFVHFFILCSIK